jgi:subtilisin family serine protease
MGLGTRRFKKMRNKNKKIKLLPYKREEVLTIQDAAQKAGWEITAFNLPKAWEYTQGEGVVVAVLDTGVDLSHEDLFTNLLPGKNFVNNNDFPQDENGHGSHVTGIICASNNEIGVVGVAPKAKVIPVKVLDKNGSGNLQNVADGIIWATDQKVDFITMSLGSPNPVPVIHEAIKYAESKGVVVFCAAGNAGKTHQIFYPANYKETIGIGAIDENFNRARFSCTGDDLDFLAPGVKILSTVPTNWYAVLSGTSMANPFVVGMASLLLSYKRKNNLDIKLENSNDYREQLKKYTTQIPDNNFSGQKFFEGFGIIDPRKLEEWIKNN